MIALSRIILATLSALFVVAQGPVAIAQSDIPLPPVRSSVDDNGVDLLSGKVIFSTTDVAIGPSDSRGLNYSRQWIERGWRPTLLPVLSGTSSNPVVTFNGRSVSFTFAGLDWVPDAKDGSKFTASPGSATYTSSNGLTIQFVTQDGYTYPDNVTTWGHPTTVTFPNGIKWNFAYRAGTYTEAYVDPECIKNCVTEYYNYYWKRLSSVKSSAGYQLKLNYVSNSLTSEEDVGYWIQVSRVTGINNNVESCDPVADSCAVSPTWPHADYGYPPSGSDIATMTDPAGQIWTYQYQATREMIGIVRPTAAGPAVTYGYTSTNGVGKVTSVAKGGGTWTYSYSSGATTVTDPTSYVRHVVFDPSTFLVSSDQNEKGQTTLFTYCQTTDTNCPFQRPKTITFPEGDTVSYEYDTRGNTTKTTRSPKPGSGLTPIIALASYPSTCSNQKTCNQPISTTDPRGAVTDYTYDGAHGGALTITGPAATPGTPRPEVRYSYTAITSTVSGDAVYELTGVSTCRSTASCVGTADETKSVNGYSTGNLLATSQTVSAGDGSLTSTVAFGYDSVGNLTSTDGPLAGTVDVSRTIYDALRRPVMRVGPDPDGVGPHPNRAVRYGYDSQSRANTVAAGTSDSSGANFSAATTVTTSFDAADRKIMETVAAGSTTYQVRQYSYDPNGRLDCTALRMNSATWSSLPGACTLATTGAAGPDRITRNSYDELGRLKKAQTAYGVTGETSDELVNTYTINGMLATITDAENNTTTYEYDGFDRRSKTRYPGPVKGSGVSSTTDYEQLSYDAGSNVTSRRLRDGQLIGYTYDNLNRLTYKDTPNIDWDVSYTYNLIGKPLSATGNGWAVNAWAYDALGRMVTEQNYNATTYHAYDLAGRQTRLTWHDGFYVDYDYNVTGEMTAIRENGATSGVGVLATYSYDDLGGRTGVTRGNGTTTSYSYDAISRLASLSQDLGGSNYDFTNGFTYNPASQIASVTHSNDVYAWNGHYDVDRSYTPNGLNQLTTAGSTSLGYDGRGNLISSGSSNYVYSPENWMWTAPGVSLAYEPGGGQLLQLYNTGTGADMRFAWSGSQMIAELGVPWTILRRYVPGPGTDEPVVWYEGSGTSDRRWLHADERGSVVALTDSSGNVISGGINRYDEYGVPASANIGRFQYTGQAWLPELGMYYYKARMYSPTLGRFMQTDPIGYGDGMNMYGYVGGDPVNFADPTGTDMTTGFTKCYGNCGPGYANTPSWVNDFFSQFSWHADGSDKATPREAYNWLINHGGYTASNGDWVKVKFSNDTFPSVREVFNWLFNGSEITEWGRRLDVRDLGVSSGGEVTIVGWIRKSQSESRLYIDIENIRATSPNSGMVMQGMGMALQTAKDLNLRQLYITGTMSSDLQVFFSTLRGSFRGHAMGYWSTSSQETLVIDVNGN